MKKNKERREQVRFSAAKFKQLPMAEKLAYLRTAFHAVDNGLQVVDRRRSTGDQPFARMLPRAEFDRLTIEHKLAYLSRTIRALVRAERKLRSRLLKRRVRAPLTPVAQ